MRTILKYAIVVHVALYSVHAAGGHVTPPSPCQKALVACLTLTGAQDASIANLRADNAKLASQLASANSPPVLPTWAVIGLSLLAGIVIGSRVK